MPTSLPGLDVFAKYWRIRMHDRVTAPYILLMLNNESKFSGRIIRAEATAEDIAAGMPGALRTLDVSRINGGYIDTSGVDLDILHKFSTDLGDFVPRLSLTWVNEFRAVDFLGMPGVDRAGTASPFGTVPTWRAIGSIEWRKSFAEVSVDARYVPKYYDASVLGRNGRILPAQTLVDFNVSVDLDSLLGYSGPWHGTTIAFGVENVFDVPPHHAEVGSVAGLDLSQADLRQRFCHVTLSKRF